MDPKDPFGPEGSYEGTVMRPAPGGKRTEIPFSPQPNQVPLESHGAYSASVFGHVNRLEGTVAKLLVLLTQLKHAQTHPDPGGLKRTIINEIGEFQQVAQRKGIDHQTISATRYVLCTVLDEAVLNTPWGHNSGWANQSLLSSFHKEVAGGERFFTLLKSLSQDPTKNRDLLEVMYICLALGFEGRYRIVEGGRDKLGRVREWLYQILQRERGSLEPALSPHWEGVADRRNRLLRFVPLWVFGAGAAGLLTAVFWFFLFKLNVQSDGAFRDLFAIKAPTIDVREQFQPQPPGISAVSLPTLLSDEIEKRELNVEELSDRSVVTIFSDSLFLSGSALIDESVIPLVRRITQAMNQVPGQVVINGHTDSVPIRTARYPSNWHLSQTRAEAVAELIKENIDEPERVTAEGRADAEPVASNKTPTGRARNRRVDIVVSR